MNRLSAGCVNTVVAWDTDYRRHADQKQKNLLLIQTWSELCENLGMLSHYYPRDFITCHNALWMISLALPLPFQIVGIKIRLLCKLCMVTCKPQIHETFSNKKKEILKCHAYGPYVSNCISSTYNLPYSAEKLKNFLINNYKGVVACQKIFWVMTACMLS